jgi:endonuclease YncB( thermonuclease family)
MRRAAFLCLTVLLIAAASARADTITGIPTVIDGGTVRIGERLVRLHGIDAPDPRQTCRRDGRDWGCGRDAAYALADIVGRHWVSCEIRERRADFAVATCIAGPIDIAREIVRKGFALADRRVGDAYIAAEDAARTARAGLWNSTFQLPWDWRAANP